MGAIYNGLSGHEHSRRDPHSSDHDCAHSHGHGHGKHDHEHGDSESIAEDEIRYQKARRQLLCASFLLHLYAGRGRRWLLYRIALCRRHLLADCAGFARLVGLHCPEATTLKYTYGYQRAENRSCDERSVAMAVDRNHSVPGCLRVLHPADVNGKYMFFIASFGLE